MEGENLLKRLHTHIALEARHRIKDAESRRKDAVERKEGKKGWKECAVPGFFGAEGRVGEVDDVAGSTG